MTQNIEKLIKLSSAKLGTTIEQVYLGKITDYSIAHKKIKADMVNIESSTEWAREVRDYSINYIISDTDMKYVMQDAEILVMFKDKPTRVVDVIFMKSLKKRIFRPFNV